jgi:hypothetical protein
LYDFQVKVQPSNIPGAGQGAFLTYLGARRLKRRYCQDDDDDDRWEHHVSTTHEPLEGVDPQSHLPFKLTLTGPWLHGNYGLHEWPKALWQAHAAGNVAEEIRLTRPPRGFGPRGQHCHDMYEPAPHVDFDFCRMQGFLDLGRYAPWTKQGT